MENCAPAVWAIEVPDGGKTYLAGEIKELLNHDKF